MTQDYAGSSPVPRPTLFPVKRSRGEEVVCKFVGLVHIPFSTYTLPRFFYALIVYVGKSY